MAKKKKKNSSKNFSPPKIKIRVIGIGGGAASILDEMADSVKKPLYLIADTDERAFNKISSTKLKTFEFGSEETKGWGTGMNPEVGEKAAKKVRDKFKDRIGDADFVFFISSLGGGVGSGASPVFAEIIKSVGVPSIGIFTLPFEFEGNKKREIAKDALTKIKANLSGIAVLENDEILEYSEKKASLQKSLSSMNEVLSGYIEDLIEMISKPGIINIDFADLKTILEGKGQQISFGKGEGKGPDRAEEALRGVFDNPFFKSSSRFKKILFNISGGSDLKVREVEMIANSFSKLNPNARIIFGISRKSKSSKRVKITLLSVGDSGHEKKKKKTSKKKSSKKGTKKKNKSKDNKKSNKKNSSKKNKKEGKKNKKSSSKKKPQKKKRQPKRKTKKEKNKKEKVKIKEKNKDKEKIRKSALEVKREKQKEEEKEWADTGDWEVPTFLRKRMD